MLQELSDDSESQVLKTNKSQTKVLAKTDTSIYINNAQIKKVETWDRDTTSEIQTRQGDSKKNHGRMDSIRQSPQHLQV